jgi:hypothetical protein
VSDSETLTVRVYRLLSNRGPMTARSIAESLGLLENLQGVRLLLSGNKHILRPAGVEGRYKTYAAVPGCTCDQNGVHPPRDRT